MNREELAAKREVLLRKREALKAKLELERRLALIGDLLDSLHDKRIGYTLRYDHGAFEWIADRFPFVFSGIDWRQVPGHTKVRYLEDEDKDRLIAGIVVKHLKPSDTVTVKWGNADYPCLEVKAEAVINHTALFADECEDLWVIHPETGFCLECYHEGYIGYKAGDR